MKNTEFSDWVNEKENTFSSPDPLTPDELFEEFKKEEESKDDKRVVEIRYRT